MVTAVDPYSGAFASANSMQSFESEDMEYQQLKIQSIPGDGFGRGEFELVDGATALRLVVRNAPTPDPDSARDLPWRRLKPEAGNTRNFHAWLSSGSVRAIGG